jgi:hypothetical protein
MAVRPSPPLVLELEPAASEESRDALFALLSKERARRVQESAPRSHEHGGVCQDLVLQTSEARELARVDAPARVRLARERSRAAARGVGQDAVEAPRWRLAGDLHDEPRAARARRQLGEATRARVPRGHACAERRERERLAA